MFPLRSLSPVRVLAAEPDAHLLPPASSPAQRSSRPGAAVEIGATARCAPQISDPAESSVRTGQTELRALWLQLDGTAVSLAVVGEVVSGRAFQNNTNGICQNAKDKLVDPGGEDFMVEQK